MTKKSGDELLARDQSDPIVDSSSKDIMKDPVSSKNLQPFY